jgi:pimeloyl-ACP methyl ester carboxylesterase
MPKLKGFSLPPREIEPDSTPSRLYHIHENGNAMKSSRAETNTRAVLSLGMLLILHLSGTASAAMAPQKVDGPVQTRSVESPDGVQIVYDVRGSGETTLVFLHCWACNRHFWKDQVDVFASHYRVVTIDLAGHGDSGKNLKRWSTVGLAQDVVAVANDLHLQRIILVGHSMGGTVSLQAARELHGRVLGVVLVDSINDVNNRRSIAAAEADAGHLRANFKGYFSNLSAIFTTTSDPAIRHWVEEQAMNADPAAAIALKLDTPNIDPKELFAHAGVPIRGIDAVAPLSEKTNFAENRKYANYDAILVSDSGHFIPLEQPEEFNRDLERWVLSLNTE